VLDRCEVAEVMLVGHSGGGATAIGLALAQPQRVRRLLLLAPGAPGYPWPMDDPYFKDMQPLIGTQDRDGIAALAMRTWAGASADQAAWDQVRGATDALFRVGDRERPDPDGYDRLGEIKMPAAMVIGDRDYPPMVSVADDIAGRIPGCRRIVARGADHLLPLRMPGQLANLAVKLDTSEDLPAELA